MEEGTRAGQTVAIEEAQSEALEQRITHPMHQRMDHLVWELDTLGTGELTPAAELAARGSQVFELLERMPKAGAQ